MRGDGNCIFRSFSVALGKDENQYTELKEALIQELRRNSSKYIHIVDLAEEMTVENYIDWISQRGAWGGAVELVVLMNFLGKRIVIYNQIPGNPDQIKVNEVMIPDIVFDKKSIRLLYNGYHYSVLFLKPNENKPKHTEIPNDAKNPGPNDENNPKPNDGKSLSPNDKKNHSPNGEKIILEDQKYIEFKQGNDRYNEIYNLLTNDITPPFISKKSARKRQKWRYNAKNNYDIKDNRLVFYHHIPESQKNNFPNLESKITDKGMFLLLKIPFQHEIKSILEKAHVPLHSSENFMLPKIKELGFWWNGVSEDVTNFIKSCVQCSTKPVKNKRPQFQMISSNFPKEHWIVDLVELPIDLRNGYFYVLDIIDHFSKYGLAKLLSDKKGSTLANAFQDLFISGGAPKGIHSDNGKEFNNQDCKAIFDTYKVDYWTGAPYHPQSQGACEVFHKTIINGLIKNFDSKKIPTQSELTKKLGEILFEYNNRVHSTTKYKPNTVYFLDPERIENKNIFEEIIQNRSKTLGSKLQVDNNDYSEKKIGDKVI